MADPKNVDAETWAKTAARLLKRTPEEARRILEELGIDAGDWEKADAQHRATMKEELDGGTLLVTKLYAAACSATMQQRAAEAKAAKAGQVHGAPATLAGEATPARAKVTDPEERLLETLPGDGPVPSDLPFRQHVPAVAPPRVLSLEPHPARGQTSAGGPPVSGTLPFANTRALPMSSPDVYAYICAAREESAERGRGACAQYGFHVSLLDELDRHWRARMQKDAALRQRVMDLMVEMRARLRSR